MSPLSKFSLPTDLAHCRYAIACMVLALIGLYFLSLIARQVWWQAPVEPFTATYTYTEWMVDYSHGFIRRGLGGEAVKLLGDILGLKLPWAIWVIGLTGLILFLGVMFVAIAAATHVPLLLRLALSVSPLGVPFLGLQGFMTLRKDAWIIVLCIGFFPFLRFIQSKRLKVGLIAIQFSLLVPIAVLLHEAAIFFCLPAAIVLTVLWVKYIEVDVAWRKVILSVGLIGSISAFYGAVRFSILSPEDLIRLCSAWAEAGVPVSCEPPPGALRFMSSMSTDAIQITLNSIATLSLTESFVRMTIGALIIGLHIWILSAVGRIQKDVTSARGLEWALLPMAALFWLLPLFLVAVDWGRFVFVWLSVWTIVLLDPALFARRSAFGNKREEFLTATNIKWERGTYDVSPSLLVVALALGLSGILVHVPHCCTTKLSNVSPVAQGIVHRLLD